MFSSPGCHTNATPQKHALRVNVGPCTQVYYVYGFMLLVFLILAIVTVCVTIVGTYFLLNAENYQWQWTSFCAAASTALCVDPLTPLHPWFYPVRRHCGTCTCAQAPLPTIPCLQDDCPAVAAVTFHTSTFALCGGYFATGRHTPLGSAWESLVLLVNRLVCAGMCSCTRCTTSS